MGHLLNTGKPSVFLGLTEMKETMLCLTYLQTQLCGGETIHTWCWHYIVVQ